MFYNYLSRKIGFNGYKMLEAIAQYVILDVISMDDNTHYFCSSLNMIKNYFYYCVEDSKFAVKVKE